MTNNSNSLPVSLIPINRFDYNEKSKTLIAERSSLQGLDIFGRLYKDAADVGFDILGRSVYRFYFSETNRINEEDIGGWVFLPVDNYCPITSVVIIND